MELIPLALFIGVAGTFSWLATFPKRQGLRTFLCLLVVTGVSTVVAFVAYPLGSNYGRIKAYQGEKEIREFFEDIRADLKAKEAAVAQKKIEFLLENWEDTDFTEKNENYGTWIGDQVEISRSITKETEPGGGINSEAAPLRDTP